MRLFGKPWVRRLLWRARAAEMRAGLHLPQMRLLWRLRVRRDVHESAFWLFRHLPPGGLFVDGGANIGQSAVSFRVANPACSVLSLEPNPWLELDLAFVGRILGDGFEYRILGIGSESSQETLYVPFVHDKPVAGEATLHPERLYSVPTRNRIRGFTGFEDFIVRPVATTIVRLDDLALSPVVVKLDLQGHELGALKGMAVTLRDCSPLLMLENNPQMAECVRYLAGFGYTPFTYEERRHRVVAGINRPFLHAFFLSQEHKGRLGRAGIIVDEVRGESVRWRS